MSTPTRTYRHDSVLPRDQQSVIAQLSSPAVLVGIASALGLGAVAGYLLSKKQFKPSSRITTLPKNNVDLEVIHVYEDDAGESHFGYFTIPLADQGPIGALSKSIDTGDAGFMFRYTSGRYNYPAHTAPRRQFIVHLDGGVRITTSDGHTKDIMPGQVQYVSDTRGKGHQSESINGDHRYSVFISVPDSWQPPARTKPLFDTKGPDFT